MATYNTPTDYLKSAINSVITQAYPLWQLCIADDHSTSPDTLTCLKSYAQADPRIKVLYRQQNGHISAATNSALTLAEGNYIAFMDHDDELHPTALTLVAEAIHQHPDVEFIYSDEDKIDEQGNRSEPHFKSDFNYELLLTQNYICHLAVFKKSLTTRINGLNSDYNGAQDHDFILRALEHVATDKIFHIPKVLYHWRIHSGSTAASTEAKPYAIEAGRRAVSDHLCRVGVNAKVSAHPDVPFWHKVRFELGSAPNIDIIIPTRDRIDLMRMCVNSILERSSYKNYCITIVDNGSVEDETLNQFRAWTEREPRIKILRDDSPFNYSRLNNQAVWKSEADLVCLLNNDIEIITPDWLEEMAGIAMRKDIGCVGARLWYPNDTLQHGGVILGVGGIAGHSHKYWHKGDPGYFGRAVSLQALSAVTAACLMIKKDIYQQVNGLDENMKVAFNDVDFCLRVREQGFRNVWTPFAEMYHHESASRGQEDNPEKIARFNAEIDFMKNRWGGELITDPFYSPNLTLLHEDFSLADISRVSLN
jgi:GT2 family glycosyltransferase